MSCWARVPSWNDTTCFGHVLLFQHIQWSRSRNFCVGLWEVRDKPVASTWACLQQVESWRCSGKWALVTGGMCLFAAGVLPGVPYEGRLWRAWTSNLSAQSRLRCHVVILSGSLAGLHCYKAESWMSDCRIFVLHRAVTWWYSALHQIMLIAFRLLQLWTLREAR